MAERRFAVVRRGADACFIVRDVNGQAQAWRRARLECGGPRMPDRCDALPYGVERTWTKVQLTRCQG